MEGRSDPGKRDKVQRHKSLEEHVILEKISYGLFRGGSWEMKLEKLIKAGYCGSFFELL